MSPTTVTVTSHAPPTITWRCPTCHRPETYATSERFRANANGKLVDVWLVYRCRRCDTTKNLTVVERTPVRRVPPALLRAAETNDATVARRLARDVELLRRNGAAIADGDDWTVDGDDWTVDGDDWTVDGDDWTVDGDDWTVDGGAGGGLRLAFPEPLLVRLDAVVAVAAGITRREARARLVLPAGAPRPDALRRWGDVEVGLGGRPPPRTGRSV